MKLKLKSKKIILLFFYSLLIGNAKSQVIDSSKISYFNDLSIKKEKLFTNTNNGNETFSKLKWKHYVLPATLFTYGLVAPLFINDHEDKNIWQKIVVDRPHNKTTIDNYIQYAPALSVCALNVLGNKGKNNLRDASMILLTSHIITTISVQALKHITSRVRPDSSSNRSFPSGHTAEAFANATFLYYEYKHKSILYGIAGYAMAATTAYLRMYNNKHWLSDVVAGAGIGIASMNFSYWLYPKISKKIFKSKATNTVLIPAYNNGNISMNFIKRF
jgi:membrane-associated phospholipid phosphatase